MIEKLKHWFKPVDGSIKYKWASPFIKQEGAQVKYRVKKSTYTDGVWKNAIVELDEKELSSLL